MTDPYRDILQKMKALDSANAQLLAQYQGFRAQEQRLIQVAFESHQLLDDFNQGLAARKVDKYNNKTKTTTDE